jgi:hypothetical protein
LEIIRHLFGEIRAEGEGEFVVAEVPIPRQGIRDVIRFPSKPLTIAFDVCRHENQCLFSRRVDLGCRLNWVVIGLDEI